MVTGTNAVRSNHRLITNGCRRCGGDLFFQTDRYGEYFGCLQCGAYIEPRLRRSSSPISDVQEGARMRRFQPNSETPLRLRLRGGAPQAPARFGRCSDWKTVSQGLSLIRVGKSRVSPINHAPRLHAR